MKTRPNEKTDTMGKNSIKDKGKVQVFTVFKKPNFQVLKNNKVKEVMIQEVRKVDELKEVKKFKTVGEVNKVSGRS